MAIAWLLSFTPCSVAEDLANAELMLAGAYINQKEFANIDFLKSEGEYWISLDDLAEMTVIRFEKKGADLLFSTPIGPALVSEKSLGMFQGRAFISTSLLLEKFNIEAIFSQPDQAIFLDVPWRPGAPLSDEEEEKEEGDILKPDITATAQALGFFRAQGSLRQDSNVEHDDWDMKADMGGRLGGGTWFLGAQGNHSQDAWLDRYFWNREFENQVVRLGFHNIQLHPLLTSQEFDGAQWAYNNMGIAPYTDMQGQNNLESMLRDDTGGEINIVRNDGPPGGIAELRINDKIAAYSRVGLDGRYEFLNIRKSAWSLLTIKVLLYKRDVNETPIATLDLTRMQATQSLKPGEFMARAGLGKTRSPRIVDPSHAAEHGVGFLQGRYGISENFTLMAAAQTRDENTMETLAGLRASLGANWAWSLDAASHEGSMAYSSELRGMDRDWEIWLRNFQLDRGYGANLQIDEHDHYGQSLYQVFDSLKIGLFGRDAKRELAADINYIKPGLFLSPGYGFSLSAVPNLDGGYRVSGLYSLAADKRFSLIYENSQYTVSMYYDRTLRQNFTGVYEYNDRTQDSIGLINFYWFFHVSNQSYFRAAVSHNGQNGGGVVGMQWMLTPGMELGLEYSDGYHQIVGARRSQTLSAKFNLGLANTEKGFTPVQDSMLSFVRGGISGAVYDSRGAILDMGDIQVLLNGARVSQTMAGGRFFIGNLRPGMYLVEIDEGTLPIEYKIERRMFRVEVAPGAITRVDFSASTYYGVAGKVTREDGSLVGSALVRAYDTHGKSVAVGLTGQFGYFRIDNLAPGEYKLTVEQVDAEPLPQPAPFTTITIVDDYIFDQNISIPAPPSAPEASGQDQ